jgi:hypothetical protein
MCKFMFKTCRITTSACLLALMGLGMIMLPLNANAALHGIGGQMGVQGTNCLGQCVDGLARAGDWVTITIAANYNDGFGQPPSLQGDRSVITNIAVSASAACLTFDSGNLLTLNADTPIPPGNILAGTFPMLSSPEYLTYIPVHGTNNCGTFSFAVQLPAGCGGTLPFNGNIEAYDTNNSANLNVGGRLSIQPSSDLFVVNDCLEVTKFCTNGVGENGLITFTGTVKNCGNADLTGVVVTNFFNGTSAQVFGPVTLTPGEVQTFSGSYQPTDICQPSEDTLIGYGTDPLLCLVTATNSATCSLVLTPCITVTKNCDTVALGSLNTVSGAVTNCGDVTLTNITIVDNVYGSLTTIASLAPGAGETYSVQVSNAACGSFPNTVTATGTTVCGTNISATATNTCVVTCPPNICITKGVVCAPSDGSDCGPGLAYAPSATGAAGPTNQASFCYEIVVWNCGSDVLTNVTVVDNKISSVAGSFPTTLAVNQRATNYYQASYGPNTSTTNIVTATGTGQASGITTNKVAQAIANVLPIGVLCDITLSSAGAVEGGQCEVTLDSNNGTNQSVTFTLVVTNTGSVDLDVALTGVPALVDCTDLTNAVTVPTSVLIPVGGTYTLTGCVLVSCPGADFLVAVQGTANAGTNGICIFDAEGHAVTTAPSTCEAHVCCVSPVTCRTTGGGQLIPGFTNQSCILVETTIFPASSSNGPVTKVTHGGQLGAPYSHKDCGEILGNPCIRGQWEHNRHYPGKGNARDVITALHTVTPKGQFDSLSCACLPCCDPDTGALIPATIGPGKKFELCNPDDHKICGPMPRPAPANALIWSGIGVLKHADDNGNKGGEWVILRVYIEDRSEPGGGHPGGSVDPADIYSFQAWRTGVPVSKKPNYDNIAPAFRTALAQDSCAFLEALADGSLPPGTLPANTVSGVTADVIDKGPLESGNRQIHPSTSATCTP